VLLLGHRLRAVKHTRTHMIASVASASRQRHGFTSSCVCKPSDSSACIDNGTPISRIPSKELLLYQAKRAKAIGHAHHPPATVKRLRDR
jgi:hypothetical protein